MLELVWFHEAVAFTQTITGAFFVYMERIKAFGTVIAATMAMLGIMDAAVPAVKFFIDNGEAHGNNISLSRLVREPFL